MRALLAMITFMSLMPIVSCQDIGSLILGIPNVPQYVRIPIKEVVSWKRSNQGIEMEVLLDFSKFDRPVKVLSTDWQVFDKNKIRIYIDGILTNGFNRSPDNLRIVINSEPNVYQIYSEQGIVREIDVR